MTRREKLLQAPVYTGEENLEECFGLWIIPTRKKHDSGYNCMIIVVGYIDKGEKKYVRCESHIDHLWGMKWGMTENPSFSIDCDDGVIHLYHYGKSFRVADWEWTSSFEINPN